MSDTYRSAMFMQSDVDRCIEEASVRAERFQSPQEFWELLRSEAATKVRESREREDAMLAARVAKPNQST